MLGDQHGWPCSSTSAPGGPRPKHIQQTMTRRREGRVQNGDTKWPTSDFMAKQPRFLQIRLIFTRLRHAYLGRSLVYFQQHDTPTRFALRTVVAELSFISTVVKCESGKDFR